ncbi:hypothetical protein [Microbacterium flavum]|uniref:hypothetical protein n=1 Tax=Microbacterium flavum TaxID=415216 RepID=UPI0024ADD3E8|nr:hypothetical protein [Microbacterium flavum]
MRADAWVDTIFSIVLAAVLVSVLVLALIATRRPTGPLVVTAGALAVAGLVAVAVLPWGAPAPLAALIALLAVAAATVGGDPFVRWVLDIADGGRTPEGSRGGILVELMHERAAAPRQEEILRGGTTIGYLERLAAALSLVVGFPAAIAVIVALKGVGRFSELATPAARERFIVGTLASLLWACTVSGVAALAVH